MKFSSPQTSFVHYPSPAHLQVPVDDSHVVAVGNNAHNGSDHASCIAFRVVALLHNRIKQLPASCYLHRQAHITLVLIHTLQGGHR